MLSPRSILLVLLAGLIAPSFATAQQVPVSPPEPTFDEIVEGLLHQPGLVDTYLDRRSGRVWLVVPPPDGPRGEAGRFLYVEGLVSGLGSNAVGLDRGQLGPARLIAIRRLGGRVLVEQLNTGFRADSGSAAERRAAVESFATSVLWAGEIAAVDGFGNAIVDITPFLLRDAHGVVAKLASTGQGSYTLDPERSVVDLDRTLGFTRNVEFEALLTFAGNEPGPLVSSVAPSPESVSLVQHQSWIALPESAYRPRRFDPRAGSFAVSFLDYGAALDRPIDRRRIVRHHLEQGGRPIVYYVDPAIPEPIRSAVVDGASWWTEAFEAAGFTDAFRVELLPDGVHPLDIRYNVIQWVHRSTRGWSYGGGVIDPRTGEMLKGHVSLGSLRVRQDRLLFEGLLGAERTGSGAADDPIELALARIRQLAAHEVGHTLGLAHNFAASTYGERASVMDYPAPWIRVDGQGGLDTSQAYAVGLGAWDLQAIRWAYSAFGDPRREEEELTEIVRQGLAAGLVFLSDSDARPAGAAHPRAALWDNGEDPVESLRETLRVRRIALERFGPRNVVAGTPLAKLEEVLATLYFHHRYQAEATVKLLGGIDYRHALRGDGQPLARPVDGATQRRALEVLLEALDPGELELSEETVAAILPRPAEHPKTREQFRGATDPLFDPLSAAGSAARLVIDGLLQPQRCARMVNQRARNPDLPSLEEVLSRLVEVVFRRPGSETRQRGEIRDEIRRVLVGGLVDLAGSPATSAAVRQRAESTLERLAEQVAGDVKRPNSRYLARQIGRHFDRSEPELEPVPAAAPLPPGSPIGCSLDPQPSGG